MHDVSLSWSHNVMFTLQCHGMWWGHVCVFLYMCGYFNKSWIKAFIKRTLPILYKVWSVSATFTLSVTFSRSRFKIQDFIVICTTITFSSRWQWNAWVTGSLLAMLRVYVCVCVCAHVGVLMYTSFNGFDNIWLENLIVKIVCFRVGVWHLVMIAKVEVRGWYCLWWNRKEGKVTDLQQAKRELDENRILTETSTTNDHCSPWFSSELLLPAAVSWKKEKWEWQCEQSVGYPNVQDCRVDHCWVGFM